ncbi:MAG TPA: hypothetical protein DC015_13595, partial [Aequorivita sp.]|nr:hypothetical protein [Aequorivita sp.]
MKFLATLFLISFFTACNTNPSDKYLAIAENTENTDTKIIQEHPGKKLMENNCYVCHNPKTAEDAMIA